MSFEGIPHSNGPPSETGDTSLPSLSEHRQHDQSMTDLYGSQNPFNSSYDPYYGQQQQPPVHHSRSVSYQDIAALPGLAGIRNAYPQMPQQQPSYYPATSNYAAAIGGTVSPYPQQPQPLNPYEQRERALQEWLYQYNQWFRYVQNQQRERQRQLLPLRERERLTPHLYPARHARISFGGTNQLIVGRGTTVLIQQIDSSLLDFREEVPVTTWPGPLIKGETNKDDILEYIRALEASMKHQGDASPIESYFKGHERRQLWSLLSMTVRQNGVISGADLAELLLENNEAEFEAPEEGDEVGRVRRFLTLGQRKTALEFAQKSGLWGHVASLILFNNSSGVALQNANSPDALQAQMCSMVSKFINTTLSREDPLFTLYMCLLSKLQSKKMQQKTVIADNLQQFAILIANDCEVNPGVSSYGRSSELLKFMINIRNTKTQHLINLNLLDIPDSSQLSNENIPIKYSEEIVFMNEIWEFARDHTEFIEVLVPLKIILASRMFDFGLINNASRYCFAIRQYHMYYNYYFPGKSIERHSILDWESIMNIVIDLECRIYGYDVTSSTSGKSLHTSSPSGKAFSPIDKESKSEPRTQEDITEDDSQADVDEVEDEETEGTEGDSTVDRIAVPSMPVTIPSTIRKQQHQPIRRQDSDQFAGNRNRTLSNMSTPGPDGGRTSARVRTLSRETDHSSGGPSSPVGTVPMLPTLPLSSLSLTPHTNSAFVPTTATHEQRELSFLPSGSVISNGIDDSIDGDRRGSIGSSIPLNSTKAPGSSPFSSQFPTAFSPITSPEPESPRILNETPFATNGLNTVKKNDPSTTKDSNPGKESKSKGWFGNILEKVAGPKQAILPDDSNPSIVFVPGKGWVDKNADPSEDNSDAIRRGPPKMPLSSATSMPSLTGAPPLLPTGGAVAGPVPLLPTGANGGPPNQFSYLSSGSTRRKPQYVDVWQETQRQKQKEGS